MAISYLIFPPPLKKLNSHCSNTNDKSTQEISYLAIEKQGNGREAYGEGY